MYINGFFCALPCEGPIGQISASTSPTEFAKICFILGIILDAHEKITHYEPHTSLGPFLTSSLPVPSTFAQCYALRHPQHTPYSIAQLHSYVNIPRPKLGYRTFMKLTQLRFDGCDVHLGLNPPPMVTVMPAKLFIITATTSLYTFNCVLHKGQVHTIRHGGCCLLALVQGYKLKDDLKHSDAY
jgi:hypothetical protein